ncbi:DivIVA domain-containing protein [Streptomyces sp. SCSIO 30461]|uniref:DivIVA domain-containing protein n=1 Tax=Streptomyces sp. SCSIO 30461 TaxID=3118085 RepID=UPI0030D55911
MFWFLLIAMVVVVAAVTLAVVGGGGSEILPDAAPEQLVDPLPVARPVGRADIEALRLPLAPRGYRMADVDDVLDRLGAEIAERDARILQLESALAEPRQSGGGMSDKRPEPGPGEQGGGVSGGMFDEEPEPGGRSEPEPGERQGDLFDKRPEPGPDEEQR